MQAENWFRQCFQGQGHITKTNGQVCLKVSPCGIVSYYNFQKVVINKSRELTWQLSNVNVATQRLKVKDA